MSNLRTAPIPRFRYSGQINSALRILGNARLHLANHGGSWDNGDKVAWLILYEKFSDLLQESSRIEAKCD